MPARPGPLRRRRSARGADSRGKPIRVRQVTTAAGLRDPRGMGVAIPLFMRRRADSGRVRENRPGGDPAASEPRRRRGFVAGLGPRRLPERTRNAAATGAGLPGKRSRGAGFVEPVCRGTGRRVRILGDRRQACADRGHPPRRTTRRERPGSRVLRRGPGRSLPPRGTLPSARTPRRRGLRLAPCPASPTASPASWSRCSSDC